MTKSWPGNNRAQLKRAAPFDDPDWIYELKMDGFRALAIIEHGRAQLISRNGHPFASFSALAESISDSLPNVNCGLPRLSRERVALTAPNSLSGYSTKCYR